MQLVQEKKAYYCFCASERLDKMREEQQARKMAPKYDRHWLNLTEQEIQDKIANGEKYVIRFKIPDSGEFICNDIVKGEVKFKTSELDDFVILKSDGFPTYHLAHIVDDHFMKITHVLRGDEWLPSLPKHILLWQAFGWESPVYAHLPLLLGADKSKLSKRQGDVAVEDYLEKGYLPEAILNFVALLGWNPGEGSEQEIFSMDELIENLPPYSDDFDYNEEYETPVLTAGKSFILGCTNETKGIYNKLPVIIFDDFTTDRKYVNFLFKVKSSAMKLLTPKTKQVNLKYVFYMMQQIKFNSSTHKRYYLSEYSKIKIPLPPLEVQEKIVEEIENYQNIVDGAKKVVDSYKPSFKIDNDWNVVELGSVCELINGRAYSQEELLEKGKTPVLRVGNFFSNKGWYYSDLDLDENKYCDNGDLLYAWSASFGPKIWDGSKVIFHYHIWKIKINDRIDKMYLYHLLDKKTEEIKSTGHGIAMMHVTKCGMEKMKIPLPPLEIQKQIAARIEEEQKLVDANKKLIELFEKKIKDKIAEVWGE